MLVGKRWAQFLLFLLTLTSVGSGLCQFQQHSYASINLRQFYINTAHGLRPTKRGIALRLPEWVKLKYFIYDVTEILQNEGK